MLGWRGGLLTAFTDGDTEVNRVQLDAIRAAGTIIVGTGGATALLLAARRQRSTEIALKQTETALKQNDRDQLLQEQDAAARRITELYSKLADQLGSDKAPVRLAGLYALERLAQDNISQRQTIVNVWCAYLRMSYSLPGDVPDDTAGEAERDQYRERIQEREVRLTAQRLLAAHLNADNEITFWSDIDIGLTGAVLINIDLECCTLRTVTFTSATSTTEVNFTGEANLSWTTFAGVADFRSANFDRHAIFVPATFAGLANFIGTSLDSRAEFGSTTFADDTCFSGITFKQVADFGWASFAREIPTEVQAHWEPRPSERNGPRRVGRDFPFEKPTRPLR